MKEYTAFLVPQFDLLVRDPITMEIMLPKGEIKPLVGKAGRYWRRRINEGCVKIVKKTSKPNIKSNKKTNIKPMRKTVNREN